jgi:hypothetical protein
MKRLMLIAFGAILTLALAVPGWAQNTTGNTPQTKQTTTPQKETKEEKKARKEAERAKKKADKDTNTKPGTTTTNKN